MSVIYLKNKGCHAPNSLKKAEAEQSSEEWPNNRYLKRLPRLAPEIQHLGYWLLEKENNTFTIANRDVTLKIWPSTDVEFNKIGKRQSQLTIESNSSIKLENPRALTKVSY